MFLSWIPWNFRGTFVEMENSITLTSVYVCIFWIRSYVEVIFFQSSILETKSAFFACRLYKTWLILYLILVRAILFQCTSENDKNQSIESNLYGINSNPIFSTVKNKEYFFLFSKFYDRQSLIQAHRCFSTEIYTRQRYGLYIQSRLISR